MGGEGGEGGIWKWNLALNRLNSIDGLELISVEKVGAAQKIKFSIKDFPSKCDQIRSFPRIWPDLPKKSLIGNFLFCTVGFGAKIGGWPSQDLNVHMRFHMRRIGM